MLCGLLPVFRPERDAEFHLEVRVSTTACFFLPYPSSRAHSALEEAANVKGKTPALEKVTRAGLTENVTFQWRPEGGEVIKGGFQGLGAHPPGSPLAALSTWCPVDQGSDGQRGPGTPRECLTGWGPGCPGGK